MYNKNKIIETDIKSDHVTFWVTTGTGGIIGSLKKKRKQFLVKLYKLISTYKIDLCYSN